MISTVHPPPRSVKPTVRGPNPDDHRRMRAQWNSASMEQRRYSGVDQDVSQGKRQPWAKMSRYFHEKLNLGASVESVVGILDEWRQQVKAWAGALGALPLSVAYRRALDAECRANLAQYLAAENPTLVNLENAIRETDKELEAEHNYRDAMHAELMRQLHGSEPSPIGTPPRRAA